MSDPLTGSNRHGRETPQEIAEEILEGLTDLEAEVVRLRFGTGRAVPMIVEKVAKKLNITRERVRLIESKILSRLKKRAH